MTDADQGPAADGQNRLYQQLARRLFDELGAGKYEEHRAIADALRTRDPAKARAAMRGHLAAVLDHLLFATEEAAVEEARQAARSTRNRYQSSNMV